MLVRTRLAAEVGAHAQEELPPLILEVCGCPKFSMAATLSAPAVDFAQRHELQISSTADDLESEAFRAGAEAFCDCGGSKDPFAIGKLLLKSLAILAKPIVSSKFL